MKRIGIVLGILLLVGALFPATAFAASTSSQHSTVTTSKPHLLLTKKGYQAQKQLQHKNSHGVIVFGQGDLFWHGGSVQAHPNVFLIFWGNNFNAGGGTLTADALVVVNYFVHAGTSKYFNILSQYFGGNASAIANGMTVGGVYLDTVHGWSFDGSCGGPTIHDSSIQGEVGTAIATNGWPKDTANSLYLVYTESGFLVNDDAGSCSGSVFCAYHSNTFVSSSELAYAAMPYPDFVGCSFLSDPNLNAAGDALANFSSHESAEAITDPVVGSGWLDFDGFEIGDKCEIDGNADGNTLVNGGFFFGLQTLYSNASHNCQNWYTPQTAGVYRPSTSTFFLKNSNSGGGPDETVNFGAPGDIPLAGDWTGKGFDTIGVYRPSTQFFYLKNTNTGGAPDIAVNFGAPGDIPVVGDFCAFGEDGIGVFRPSTAAWFLRCTASGGPPNISILFGVGTDIPVVGDWSNFGFDGIGVFRPSSQMWFLANCAGCSVAYGYPYGGPGDKPLTGDYSSQGFGDFGGFAFGVDTPGVFRPSTSSFFLANQQGPVPPAYSFPFGLSTDIPMIGQWVSYGPGTVVFQ